MSTPCSQKALIPFDPDSLAKEALGGLDQHRPSMTPESTELSIAAAAADAANAVASSSASYSVAAARAESGFRPLVISGPSGSGKSSVVKRIMAMDKFKNKIAFCVSHTTRTPRPGEVDGVDYHFTTNEEMEARMVAGDFVETAEFSGNLYGTSKAAIHDCLQRGKVCILDIDSQGVLSMKQSDFHPVFVSIKPPSVEELKRRLEKRGTETSDSINRRLEIAAKELEFGCRVGMFDAVIVNEDLDVSSTILAGILQGIITDSNL